MMRERETHKQGKGLEERGQQERQGGLYKTREGRYQTRREEIKRKIGGKQEEEKRFNYISANICGNFWQYT